MNRLLKILAVVLAAATQFGATYAAGHDPDRRKQADIVLNYSFNRGAFDSQDMTGTSGTSAGNAGVAAGNRFLTLDGTGDWVTTSDAAGLDVGDNFSVSFWVQPNAPGTAANRVPVGRYAAAANKRSWIISFRYNDTPQRIYGVVGNGTGAPIVYAFNTTLPTSGWHHVVMVYANNLGAGNRWKCYYDGAELPVSTLVTETGATTPFTTDIGVRFGNDNDGTAATAWKGDIDDVRIFNRSLTSTEAVAIFSSGRLLP